VKNQRQAQMRPLLSCLTEARLATEHPQQNASVQQQTGDRQCPRHAAQSDETDAPPSRL
jgi:hypothetical protein